MPHRAPEKFEKSGLILCEGPDDVAFFGALVRDRGLATKWHVRATGKNRKAAGGNTKFGERIRSFRVGTSGFAEKIKRLVIVADADLDAGAAFENVQNQLRFAEIDPPSHPNELKPGALSVAVVILPYIGVGCLESICCEPAEQTVKVKIRDCVSKFVEQVADQDWTEVQRSKLRLRVLMAAAWRKDPGVQLMALLNDQGTGADPTVIPLQHASFDWIANLIDEWAI